jgi:hypothetical protein
LAWAGDSTVTALTLEVAEEASDEDAWDLMMEANAEPFCSRLIRLATGVLGLKNATQLALIWATAAGLLPEGALAAADVGGAAPAEVVAGALAPALALEPDDEPLPLLLQAATATAGSRANVAMEITRTGWSRI